jgi:hypothetical protein
MVIELVSRSSDGCDVIGGHQSRGLARRILCEMFMTGPNSSCVNERWWSARLGPRTDHVPYVRTRRLRTRWCRHGLFKEYSLAKNIERFIRLHFHATKRYWSRLGGIETKRVLRPVTRTLWAGWVCFIWATQNRSFVGQGLVFWLELVLRTNHETIVFGILDLQAVSWRKRQYNKHPLPEVIVGASAIARRERGKFVREGLWSRFASCWSSILCQMSGSGAVNSVAT